ncbi:hypothetical protein ABG775_23095 [Peribacillus simplex]|uniref:hypothetical protein n=1 Tax=Peribacillus TaxID=2675229 RepID=UPI00177D7430|nr:hypothetical protein [Brevibacillus sp. JNUCC-41]QOS91047.1 hypothetical protein JNUCC41_04635 [Brevibacillus sp. JNUCC-41]
MNLLSFSKVKILKLSIHALLIGVLLTLVSLIVNDVISIVFHERMTLNLIFINVIMAFWVLWAMQNTKYQK